MGCFNIACSISNLSIGYGERAYFIPLTPNIYRGNHLVGVKSYLTYPNSYYNPFCLPIEGYYNDYGTLENIIENENTKALEDFFGIDIESIVEIITRAQYDNMTSSNALVIDKFAVDQSINSYGLDFGEDFLLKLGLIKHENEYFYFPKFANYHVHLQNDNSKYTIFNKEKNELIYSSSEYYLKKDFQQVYENITGYILNVSEQNQSKVKLLLSLSGMFVLSDIYNHLANINLAENSLADSYLTSYQLEGFGFYKVPKEEQFLADPHKDTLWRKENSEYEVKLGKYGSTILHKDLKEYYVFGDYRFFNEIKRHWFDMTKTNFSDVFPSLASKNRIEIEEFEMIKNWFEQMMVAPFGWTKDYSKKFDVYNLKNFAKKWSELNHETLDIVKYETEHKYDKEYEDFKEAIDKYNKELEEIEDEREKRLIEWNNPFDTMSIDKFEFSRFFKDMKFFKKIYKKLIENGLLKSEFTTFKAFQSTMDSANRFYFPAMNGEQHGNDVVSKALLEKSLEIVNKRIYDREE